MFSQKCIPTQKFAVLGAHRNTIPAVWYDRCVTKCAVVKGLMFGSSFRPRVLLVLFMLGPKSSSRVRLVKVREGVKQLALSMFAARHGPNRRATHLVSRNSIVCILLGLHYRYVIVPHRQRIQATH